MTGLTFRIPTTYPPQCPLCRRELSANATEFVDGLAFCTECRLHAETLALSVEIDVCRCVGVDSGYSSRAGLTTWSPSPAVDSNCTAAQYQIATGRCTAPVAEYVQRWAGQIRASWGKAVDLDSDDPPQASRTRTTPSSLSPGQSTLFDDDPPPQSRDVHG
jgi:hypothetical protein